MSIRVAIVSPNKEAYSETFIHDQVAHLSFDILFLYGGYLPYHIAGKGSFLFNKKSEGKLNHLLTAATQKVSKERLQKAIRTYLLEEEVEAVLCHYGPTAAEMMEVCQPANIPLFVYFHGYDLYRQKEVKEYGGAYIRLFQYATGIFAVSRQMIEKLVKMGAPEEKITYNPCGVNLDLFEMPELMQTAPILLSAGRFEATKHPMATIEAFAIALETVPDAQLRMAGSGSLLKGCKKRVDELEIDKAVTFLEVVSHNGVAKEMAQARAFVQHSVVAEDGDSEGTPVAIMEAAAMGLPVIATRHAGIPDVVIDGETGLLVEEGDIKGMARQMVRLLQDVTLAERLGRKASEHIRANFTLQHTVDKIEQVISSSLKAV